MAVFGVACIAAETAAQVESSVRAQAGTGATPQAFMVDTLPSGQRVAAEELLVYWAEAEGAREEVIRAIREHGGSILESNARYRLLRVRFAGKARAALDQLAGQLSSTPQVALVDYNSIGTAQGSDCYEDRAMALGSPGDPFFPEQWHLKNIGQDGGTPGADIDALVGWMVATGSANVVVAVVDSGTYFDHPDLVGRQLPGYDFVNEDDQPLADNPHGVFVTGLLAANACNGYGIAGVDHACKVMPIKVLDAFADGTVFDLVQGLDYARDAHVDVASLSLGGYGGTPALKASLEQLSQSGTIIVSASGNYGIGTADTKWPAASPDVITVGATNKDDHRANYSSTGLALDFVAPGHQVVTVGFGTPGSEWWQFKGTSAATPIVSGTVSILRGLSPGLPQEVAYKYLQAGAEDVVGLPEEDTPGWDPYYGHGRIDLGRTLQAFCGCLGSESLIVAPSQLELGGVSTVGLLVDFGREHADQSYWILGSGSVGATAPTWGSVELMLVEDEFFRYSVEHANGPILQQTHGQLDGAGRATGYLLLPEEVGSVPAMQVFLQAVAFDGRGTKENAVAASTVATLSISLSLPTNQRGR